MNKNAKTLGILNVVYGLLGISGTIIARAVFFLPGILIGRFAGIFHPGFPLGSAAAFAITGFFGMLMLGSIILEFLPSIIGGFGLLYEKSWARIIVLIASIIHLLAFPLGTALGIYGLWVLLSSENFPKAAISSSSTPA